MLLAARRELAHLVGQSNGIESGGILLGSHRENIPISLGARWPDLHRESVGSIGGRPAVLRVFERGMPRKRQRVIRGLFSRRTPRRDLTAAGIGGHTWKSGQPAPAWRSARGSEARARRSAPKHGAACCSRIASWLE